MFINSDQLKNRIKTVADEIFSKSKGLITFEEYISLPAYGHIILRFNLNKENYTVADLDDYEAMMYTCAKDEFLLDFMGGVYKNAGIDYRNLEKIFSLCADIYGEEKRYKSAYANLIENDARHLLNQCGISEELPVWEIQIEDEILLFTLGDRNEAVGRFCSEGVNISVHQVESRTCEGLIAAVFYAKRNNISLVNALMKAQNRIQKDA